MGTFYVDGRPVPFQQGDNILKAALEAGVEIPYFCFHPALGSLGACRLCAVKVFPPPENKEQQPWVVMSCLQRARDGMRVSMTDTRAHDYHQGVIEFLMTNHPHDCPVCDEGGECHLQDMTVANGPPYRRYEGNKRTFLNQYLGPLVWHSMDRCITCYRCVRFYQDYALGGDLGAMNLRNQVYFGRVRNGPLESPFAGNLVEVCPTGVFTDKVFRRHYSRVWDLQTAPSVCPHCSVGCNILPGAREGTLRRVRNRFHPDLNRWFLCDRGRYGHRYTEHPDRPRMARVNGHEATPEEALSETLWRLQTARGVALLGSPREDMETLSALGALAHRLGAHFSPFLTPELAAAVRSAVSFNDHAPTLAEMEKADVVLIAGDLTGHAPLMDLAVRQALRSGARLFILRDTPADLSRFAEAVVTLPPHRLTACLERMRQLCTEAKPRPGDRILTDIATALSEAKRPLFLGIAATLGKAGIETLAALAETVPGEAMKACALPGPNAFGAALVGSNEDSASVLQALESGAVDTLLVAAEDPFGTALGAGRWRLLRQRLKTLIVIDCIATDTATQADIFIPAAAWAERNGLFINYEGRAQAFAQVFRRNQPQPLPATVLAHLARGLKQAPEWLDERLTAAFKRLLDEHLGHAEKPAETKQQAVAKRHPTLPEVSALTQQAAAAQQTLELSAAPPKQTLPWLLGDYPQAGGSGVMIHTRPRRAEVEGKGDWRVALHTWYGDDPLAAFAPELAQLAPPPAARMAPAAIRAAGLEAGTELKLTGSAGTLRLPLLAEPGIAPGVIALSRAELARLGLAHGDSVEWEVTP